VAHVANLDCGAGHSLTANEGWKQATLDIIFCCGFGEGGGGVVGFVLGFVSSFIYFFSFDSG